MQKDPHEIKKTVRQRYGEVATVALGRETKSSGGCCGPSSSSPAASGCCSPAAASVQSTADNIALGIGYSNEQLASVPDGANLGLGCGNPTAIASLKPGETVLDLGSGAGFDCFIAAKAVGPNGKVIGVDMTPEMIEKARQNAQKAGIKNAEFRLGELEHLPIADATADIVISNCVINLVPDKDAVFKETYRALKPGGRVAVSDIVLLQPLPERVLKSAAMYVNCISGAILKDDYLTKIKNAGFTDIEITGIDTFGLDFCESTDPLAQSILKELGISAEEASRVARETVASMKFTASKPGA